jgi:hypothetical protein
MGKDFADAGRRVEPTLAFLLETESYGDSFFLEPDYNQL